MSLPTTLIALNQDIVNARAKITQKGGTVTSGGGSSQLATDIDTIPTGIIPTGTIDIASNGIHNVTNYASANVNVSSLVPEELDWGVNFYDFDGTLLESWKPEDVAGKTALPNIPDHSSDITWSGKIIPLTSMGWNWTLAEIQHYISVYTEQEPRIDVGMQVTTDNKIYLEIDNRQSIKELSLNFTFSGTCTIDWGDNTTTNAVSNSWHDHIYTNYGQYLIIITPSTGAITLTQTSNQPNILRDTSHSGAITNLSILRGIYLSSDTVYGGTYLLNGYRWIERCVLAYNATQLKAHMAYNTPMNACVVIPRATTSVNTQQQILGAKKIIKHPLLIMNADLTVASAQALFNTDNDFINEVTQYPGLIRNERKILLAEGATRTPQSNAAKSNLRFLVLPSTITEIWKMPFNMLSYLKFKSTVPPACADSTYFGIPTWCRILVPRGTLTAYTTATNYPSPETYTYEEYD